MKGAPTRSALERENDLTSAELHAKADALLWCIDHPSFDPGRDRLPKVPLLSTIARATLNRRAWWIRQTTT